MNELKIFNNQEFGEIRAIEIEGEPWLVGKDVAEKLGYTNTNKAILDHVDGDDLTIRYPILDSLGRKQEVTIINESGLYSLILGSKLPTAKKFKHWVTSEVLPSIRKHGAYITEELSPQLQLLINMELKQKQLEATIEETKQEVQAIRDTIVINPKAEWRKECGRILRAIGTHIGDYRKPNEEAYKALEERGHCRPSVLLSNLQNRASRNGMAPSKIANLNLLDVLENEPRLKEIYISIVKEMSIKYKVI
jgi:prophage antirepressor-like protein